MAGFSPDTIPAPIPDSEGPLVGKTELFAEMQDVNGMLTEALHHLEAVRERLRDSSAKDKEYTGVSASFLELKVEELRALLTSLEEAYDKADSEAPPPAKLN